MGTRTLVAALLVAVPAVAGERPDKEFLSDFAIERCTFASRDANGGGNPLFPLAVGRRLVLESGSNRVEVTTLGETESITFTTKGGTTIHVDARVVEERELEHGRLSEVSRNFFARCAETGDVYYFGEEVDPPEGSWRAGRDGAQPGLIMPGTFRIGSRYFQEQAQKVAMDRAENLKMDLEVVTSAGKLQHCVEVKETSSIERGTSTKKYCPGVGLVYDDGAVLTEIHAP